MGALMDIPLEELQIYQALVGRRIKGVKIKKTERSTVSPDIQLLTIECDKSHREVISIANLYRRLELSQFSTFLCEECEKTRRYTEARKNREDLKTKAKPIQQLYSVWSAMLARCQNPNTKSYLNYGGRGIKVCDRWQKFENFLEDMGERPSDDHSLDRLNNDGDYEPSNCRWATKREQSVNRRTTRWVTIEGVSKPLHDWVNEFGITNTGNLYRDMRKGMSEVEALLHNKRKVICRT